MNAARWLDEASDLRVEETAVTVGRLFSPKGYAEKYKNGQKFHVEYIQGLDLLVWGPDVN